MTKNEVKESYYNKIKQENEELKNRYSWLESDSFLLDSEADIRQVYTFLRKKPESAKFIYKKYRSLQSTIRELCDPENPLYLEGVRNALEGIVQVEDSKDNLERLKQELGRKTQQIDLIDQELESKEKQLDEAEASLESIRKELENTQRQRANLRTDMAQELIMKVFKIMKVFNDITDTINELDSKWKENARKGELFSMNLSRDQLSRLSQIGNMVKELQQKIESEDLLSPENLDAYHKELLQKAQAQKEAAMAEMNAFLTYNPGKVIPKVLNNIALAMDKIENGEEDGSGGRWINSVTLGLVRGYVSEAENLLDHLQEQVENKRRRKE